MKERGPHEGTCMGWNEDQLHEMERGPIAWDGMRNSTFCLKV